MKDAPPVTPLLNFPLREPHRGEPPAILTGASKHSTIAAAGRQRAVLPGWGTGFARKAGWIRSERRAGAGTARRRETSPAAKTMS